MNIIVHLLFSCNMRRIIRKQSGVKLNMLGFMYGNILPDIRSMHKPHRLNGSLDFLVKRTQNLIRKPHQASSLYSWSKELGIITHYLSDYFCYAHQDHYDKGLGVHMLYELRMLSKYRKGLKHYRANFSRAYHCLAPDEFERWILEQNSKYNSRAYSYVRDISNALYAGSMIGQNMLSNCDTLPKARKARAHEAIPLSTPG